MPPSEPEAPSIRAVALSTRDIEDAKRLLRLLGAAGDPTAGIKQSAGMSSPERLRQRARQIIANRKKREKGFGADMFGEVAWELLLSLYVLEPESRQTVSQLVTRSGASKSTVLRWLIYLEERQFIERADHPTDRRITFIGLTKSGRERLDVYLSDTLNAKP